MNKALITLLLITNFAKAAEFQNTELPVYPRWSSDTQEGPTKKNQLIYNKSDETITFTADDGVTYTLAPGDAIRICTTALAESLLEKSLPENCRLKIKEKAS